MVYPGNPELSSQAQERVMTAFRQVIAKLQEGQREEALIGLEFVLRLDPSFTPAVNLRQQLSSGSAEIDLGEIISQLKAPSSETIDEMLVEAVESFNQRNFLEAKEKVEKVLIELPGHREARQLLGQITDALKVENQVGQFLAQAREALDHGDPQEAANFVMMAQALDPHHSGIAPTLQEIYERGGLQQEADASPAVGTDALAFETSDAGAEAFQVRFDEVAPASDAAEPLVELAPAESEFVPASEEGTPPWEGADSEVAAVDDLPPRRAAAEATTGADEAAGEPFAAQPKPAAVAREDDISDLFEADDAAAPSRTLAPPAEPQRGDELVRDGQTAFEAGDFLAAIDAWSRVYLSDPANQAVGPRIAEAKSALEELDRRIDHLLFEAQDASLSGEPDRASALVDEILALQPNHQAALELSARLSAPEEAAGEKEQAAARAMPDLEEDLFEERHAAKAAKTADAELALEWEQPPVRRLLGLPVRTAAMIGGGVVLVGALAIGLFIFSGSNNSGGVGDVTELRARAEELFQQGSPEEALRLVMEFRATNPTDEQIVARLRTRYERAVATPTPTPIPAQLIAARGLRDRGLWFHAYAEAAAGLRANPEDPALREIKKQIEDDEPMASILQSAIANSNFQSAVGIAYDLLEKYPGQADLAEVLERSLFNAALAELRAYNLTGAEGYLRELDQRRPGDDTVVRILEFISNYKARPVDMQLQVFIGSLDPRQRRPIPGPEEVAPTVTPAAPTPAATAPAAPA